MLRVNEKQIQTLLSETKSNRRDVDAVLRYGAKMHGLSLKQAAILLNTRNRSDIQRIKMLAHKIKTDIYGNRLVLFAPLYISNYCVNNCAYCSFHASNQSKRTKLTQEQIQEQTKQLIDMGHKRILLECGEDPLNCSIDFVTQSIQTIYDTKSGAGNIRRINVNIAATSTTNYNKLKKAGIGTYQLFQETYHRPTYEKLHAGPKSLYERQISAHDRALSAGIDDVGLGVLFGLYDYRFEVLSLIKHAQYLEKNFGVGPHTISVPRYRPANNVIFQPTKQVSDENFLKLIAILRIAVPYAGMIISTRESSVIRAQAFDIGISQTSAASRTMPGGYGKKQKLTQFAVADHRPLAKVMRGIVGQGLIPSFCTACYRIKRTGATFMSIAKRAHIHNFCLPNALLTFQEYLEDYACARDKKTGQRLIAKKLEQIADIDLRKKTQMKLEEIINGKRDLFF